MSGSTQTPLPRLLAGLVPDRAMGLSTHLDRHGPLPRADSAVARAALMQAVEQSGLRGRGGGGFPVAAKLRSVAAGRAPRIVVANGAEGEPASRKDELLLTGVPHLVLDGAALAASMLEAGEVVVAVQSGAAAALDAVAHALHERAREGVDVVRIAVAEVSNCYLGGEESALVSELNGGPAKPTFVPPRPFERGVGGRPTLVQNVETLADLALIARSGAGWFREVGTAEDPGSILITLSGSVANPGVYELAAGTRLGALIRAAGGPTQAPQAVLIGGYSGSWFQADEVLALELGHAAVSARSGSLGPGLVLVLPEGACGVAETARAAAYLARESSGQCGPCVHGLAAIADALGEIADGTASPGTRERIVRWSADVVGRGACHHPDGAVRLVSSCLDVFATEIERHLRGLPCRPAPGLRAVLPVPSAVPEFRVGLP